MELHWIEVWPNDPIYPAKIQKYLEFLDRKRIKKKKDDISTVVERMMQDELRKQGGDPSMEVEDLPQDPKLRYRNRKEHNWSEPPIVDKYNHRENCSG